MNIPVYQRDGWYTFQPNGPIVGTIDAPYGTERSPEGLRIPDRLDGVPSYLILYCYDAVCCAKESSYGLTWTPAEEPCHN